MINLTVLLNAYGTILFDDWQDKLLLNIIFISLYHALKHQKSFNIIQITKTQVGKRLGFLDSLQIEKDQISSASHLECNHDQEKN